MTDPIKPLPCPVDASVAEILDQWDKVQADRAYARECLEHTGPGESPYTNTQSEAWSMREYCLGRTLLAAMPELMPLLLTRVSDPRLAALEAGLEAQIRDLKLELRMKESDNASLTEQLNVFAKAANEQARFATQQSEELVALRAEIDRLHEKNCSDNEWKDSDRAELRAEISRLKAGGCARDQATTQFCAEAVAIANERDLLRAQLADWKNGANAEAKGADECRVRFAKALSCLKLIADENAPGRYNGIKTAGDWCAEQAREVLKQLKEETK